MGLRFRVKPNHPMTVQSSEILFQNATNQAEAISTGGRDGILHSAERPESSTFIDPGEKPNPELLFAGAYAACFHSAMIAVAKALGTPLIDSVVRARVGQVKDEAGDRRLVVELLAELPGFNGDQGRVLMETADKTCPYSRALRGEAVVSLVVT
jgi:osmotically inducible protein OsmC